MLDHIRAAGDRTVKLPSEYCIQIEPSCNMHVIRMIGGMELQSFSNSC